MKLTNEQIEKLLPLYREIVKGMNPKWSKMPKRRSGKEINDRIVEQVRRRTNTVR